MIGSRYSFKFLSKAKVAKTYPDSGPKTIEPQNSNSAEIDNKKRSFLKLAGMVGLGALATTFLPKKAEALVFGSTPASNTINLKDINNAKINPAKEDGNLATLATNVPAKGQASMVASLPVVIASNQTPIPVSGSLSVDQVGIKDASDNRISPISEDSVVYLRRIVKLMESQATVDSGNRQRITLDSLGPTTAITTTVPVSGTVTANIGTGSIAAGTNVIGSVLLDGQGRQMFTELARQAYNSGIRGNLIFS